MKRLDAALKELQYAHADADNVNRYSSTDTSRAAALNSLLTSVEHVLDAWGANK